MADGSLTNNTIAQPPMVPLATHHHLPIKLTHSNYPSGRTHLLALLKGYNLLDFIDEKNTCPSSDESGSNEAIVTNWIRQDSLLLAAIFGSLASDVLLLISSALTSAEAWASLNRLFASRSRSRVNQLKSDIFRVSIGARSVTKYLHYVKSKADELALIDQPVSIDNLTLFIVNGLILEYGNIIGPICTRETPLRFEQLQDLLVEHEMSLKNQENSTKNLVATTNHSLTSYNFQRAPSQANKSRGGSNQTQQYRGQSSRGNNQYHIQQSNKGKHFQYRGGTHNSTRPQVPVNYAASSVIQPSPAAVSLSRPTWHHHRLIVPTGLSGSLIQEAPTISLQT